MVRIMRQAVKLAATHSRGDVDGLARSQRGAKGREHRCCALGDGGRKERSACCAAMVAGADSSLAVPAFAAQLRRCAGPLDGGYKDAQQRRWLSITPVLAPWLCVSQPGSEG